MSGTAKSPRAAPEIVVEGVHKAFNGNQVLSGIDLEIGCGDIVAIVGDSGCGKTVLMNLMLGLLAPDRGRVRVADHSRPEAPLVDIADLDDTELAGIHTHCGVVFQRNALFGGSVLDNIALWLREVKELEAAAIAPLARKVLAAVDLPTDEAFLDTPSGKLSGGMAKRLAVARALAMDPAVIFFDEPTTGLDPTSAAHVQDLVYAAHYEERREAGARTTVIITHDKDLLTRLQPRIVMLDEGRVFFDGPFDRFEASTSPTIRPYFDLMPVLHRRAVADRAAGAR